MILDVYSLNNLIRIDDHPLFPESPTFANQWIFRGTITVINPLTRPIPVHHTLIRFVQAEMFPYNTIRVEQVRDVFNTREKGGIYCIVNPSTIMNRIQDILRQPQ